MTTTVRPRLVQTAIDAADVRATAEFWRALLGLRYRPGDEPPTDGPDTTDWVVLLDGDRRVLAVQEAVGLTPSTWPSHEVPQQLHLDLAVDTPDELAAARDRVLDLGGALAQDRFDDRDEALYEFTDPTGHLLWIFVA